MIWKFKDTETYLLGSVHAMNNKDNSHSSSIKSIYNKVNKVFFETILDEDDTHLKFYENDKLKNKISKTLFRDVKNSWLKFKLPYKDLEKSKIFEVSRRITFSIYTKHGYHTQNGIDYNLWQKSKNDKKEIAPLESLEIPYLMVENSPIEEQRKFLSMVVRKEKKTIETLKDMIQGWETCNEEILSKILRETLEELPIMFNDLIFERNKLWIDNFLSAFRSDIPTLFVVGVLHCVDSCSLQNLIIQKYGYKSELINV